MTAEEWEEFSQRVAWRLALVGKDGAHGSGIKRITGLRLVGAVESVRGNSVSVREVHQGSCYVMAYVMAWTVA